ncbi:MAG TPA: glycosyltransferase family 4 protein [Burkholderiales bacterium]|nr:glycosyltransferase family 4 protein [Burkholderiales bacterium]
MNIAQIAPLAESVPPTLYGGTERIVSYLTEELVRMGHQVTLFASGDSTTAAELVPCSPRARLDNVEDPIPRLLHMLECVCRRVDDFDVLHFHLEGLHLPIIRAMAGKTLTTLHGRLDGPGVAELYGDFGATPLVSISQAQRAPLKGARWLGTVHHGLPPSVCPYTDRPNGVYVAFLGRASPVKRLDRAIDIARRAGVRLRIAAKIDAADEGYFRGVIAPRLREDGVEFIGEINEQQKAAFLGNAIALLFPIDWPEPFGLSVIEAMSCGTPVLAWPWGALPEIIDDGITGFIVNSIEEGANCIHPAAAINRRHVRRRFVERFTAARMARDYVRLYETLLSPLPQASRSGTDA